MTLLSGRLAEEDDLPNELERLGIDTLGRLAGLPTDAVADRFGAGGLRALRLAQGKDDPLRPRAPHQALAVELELPDAGSGQQLERALELLVARLLAHSERRGRSVRALRLSARLAAGGGWRRRLALRAAATERERLLLVLAPLLEQLPGPAAVLRLEAVALGPAAGEQLSLASPEQQRRRRIGEAVRQARAAGGSEALLRVLEVDPSSRVPERREAADALPRGARVRGGVNKPIPVPVQVGADGRPRMVGLLSVSAVREEWLVEDGWWTRRPLRRRYFELVLEDGSNVVVFSEPEDGRWFRQRT